MGMIRRLCWLGTAFSAAVFLAVYLLPERMLLPAGLCCALCALFALFFRGKNRQRMALAALGLAAGLLWTTCYGALFRAPAHDMATGNETVNATGTVVDFPEETRYGSSLTVRIHMGIWRRPLVQVYAGDEGLTFRPGDEISLDLRLAPSDQLRGERFTYYEAKGIYLFGYAKGEVVLTQRPDHVLPLYWPDWAAKALKDSISRIFSGDVAGFMTALTTGDKDRLPVGMYAAFQRSGIAHVVAVSGLHVSFLAGLLGTLLGKRNNFSSAVGMLLVFFFAVATGSSPSALRAAFMTGFLLLAPLVGRENDKPTTLSTVLLILLIGCPYAAASASLQLSFAAVAGIFLVTGPLNQRWTGRIPKWKSRPLRWLRRCLIFLSGTLSTSLGALLFTAPLVAIYYNSVSLAAPLTNLLALWAVSVTFMGGLLAALAGLIFPTVGTVMAWVVAWPARWVIWVATAISKWPFSSLTLLSGYMAGWFLLSYGLLLLWLLFRKKIRLRVVAFTAVVTLAASLAFQAYPALSGALTVAVLDVGQGASTLLCSRGRAVLIDCGGNNWTNAGDIAANYIQSIGLSRLDALVLTHYHTDHANGVPELLARLEVGMLILPDVTPEEPLRQEILALAQKYGCEVELLYDYDALVTFGDAQLNIFAPLGDGGANEEGLSALCSSGTFDVLITGDMNDIVERRLVRSKNLPDIELLVVGHHGSRTSTSAELLLATRPEAAVISVGYNSYGHPTDETLARLTAAKCDIYRTDLMGTVVFTLEESPQVGGPSISSPNIP